MTRAAGPRNPRGQAGPRSIIPAATLAELIERYGSIRHAASGIARRPG